MSNSKSLVRFDRVTIDERRRLSANFVLPSPTRAYLYEEADRMLSLKLSGRPRMDSFISQYWDIEVRGEGITDMVAVGKKHPVLGEKRALSSMGKAITLFDSVRGVLSGKALSQASRSLSSINTKESARANLGMLKKSSDVVALLQDAYQAQHIHKREKGFFAKRWEDLDLVSGFHFNEEKVLSSNLRFHPIEISDHGFQIIIEGTSGELLGEQFQINQSGSVRQVRYTDALIQQLQHSTDILENTFKFQISEVPNISSKDAPDAEAKGFLDRVKAPPVKSTEQGSAKKE